MLRKINVCVLIVVIAAAVAVVALIAQAAYAEPLSTHNEEQAAYNAAIRVIMGRGCTPEFRRIRGYTVDVTADRVTIIAKEVAQDCAEKPAATARTWSHPTAREDGTPLAVAEIRGYQITVNGAVVMLPPVTTYQIDAGAKSAVIQTVDTDGQLSKALSML